MSNSIEKQVTDLLSVSYTARVSNLQYSIELADKALSLSRSTGDKSLIGKCLNQLSLFYMIRGEYKLSIEMAGEAIGYFEELGDDKGIADAKYSIAGTYYKTDNYHLGLINLVDCLQIYRKFNDWHNQARTQKSLGTIYEFFADQKNAVRAYESSIESAKEAGDLNLESNAYNPLSGIYLDQGEIEKALEVIERSITIKTQTGDTRGMAFALYGRAKVYWKMGLFAEAEVDFRKSLEIHTEMGERFGRGMCYHKLGALYYQLGKTKQAKQMLKEGLAFSEEFNIVNIKFKCNYVLYQIFKGEGNTGEALQYLERYLEQKDGVINAQTLQVIENYELITKMRSLEKEAQLHKEKADIIEKKEKAEQAARVKQEFLSTMSHEIRTPLNAVISITSLLREKASDDDGQLLKSLTFASNNLMQIINDILDFTKLETGKVQLGNSPGSLPALLGNLKQAYESLAMEKGLVLSLDSKNLHPSYEMDETKLTQILGNLISNAIKYTDKGKVDIDVEKVSEAGLFDIIQFRVSDTGVGIPADYVDEIFDSFSQPKSVTTRKQGGSGLGLAIVKKLVELHGSKICFKSDAVNGSVFYFELKLKRAVAVVDAPVEQSNRLNLKTVLLAEDNTINAMVATRLLSKWGITTVHAKNGLEAIEKAREKSYDYVLMDIHMPEMNGFDATAYIRNNENPNRKTPVFALTADITAEQKEEFAGYFNGFLLKPIETGKLYQALVNELG